MSERPLQTCLLVALANASLFFCGARLDGDEAKEVPTPVALTELGRQLHESAIVIDGHNDLPWELRKRGQPTFEKIDISKPQLDLHTDIPRLKQGGVCAQFWSVWVPAETAYDGSALATTLEQIELVHNMLERYPQEFELALTSEDIYRIRADGKIASLIGVEGGHSIEESLSVLRKLYELGARYMTLTHSDTLSWADSATDDHRNGGLSPFGEQVIQEMNSLGMMVDLSHVSVECMHDALRITKAPVIFSHSSSRAIADHPRNVPDDVLKLVAENDGVVMVNFFSGFIVPSATRVYAEQFQLQRELQAQGKTRDEIQKEVNRWKTRREYPNGTIHDLLDHIDHIAEVAGIDHVGLGSDYDGVSILPEQLEDVTCFPLITQGLIDRGYSDSDIRKILGGNLLRVMKQTEQIAQQLRDSQ